MYTSRKLISVRLKLAIKRSLNAKTHPNVPTGGKADVVNPARVRCQFPSELETGKAVLEHYSTLIALKLDVDNP